MAAGEDPEWANLRLPSSFAAASTTHAWCSVVAQSMLARCCSAIPSVVNCSPKMSVFYPRRDTWHCSSNFPAHGARFSDCYRRDQIDSQQATTLLGVSARQFWRLLAAYRKRGGDALTHGTRGRRPGNATSNEIAARVIELTRDRYPDANHTHLTQLLEEREGIRISRQTLRRILAAAGLKSPRRRRPPRRRVRRERMPREGMLIQIDGSHHRWLGDDYPQFALHLAVDDATGKVLAARFRPDEDACGYFELLGESDQGARYPIGPLQRPPQRVRSLPAVRKAEAGRGRYPVRAGDGGTGDTPGVCPLGLGQRKGETSRRDLPGPPGHLSGDPPLFSDQPRLQIAKSALS